MVGELGAVSSSVKNGERTADSSFDLVNVSEELQRYGSLQLLIPLGANGSLCQVISSSPTVVVLSSHFSLLVLELYDSWTCSS